MLLDAVPPRQRRYRLGDIFTFRCYRDLSCFNACCRNKHLPLSPYDVVRLKKALRVDSDAFLVDYAVYSMDPASGFPILSLKMREDEDKTCPFVSTEGCEVYNDRPTVCRLFPLGRASGFGGDGRNRDQFFFLQEAPGCLGRKEPKAWTVKDWLRDQGVSPYIAINDRMLDLLFHPKRHRDRPLDDRQLQKLIVACYNLDEFRDFVAQTGLLTCSGLDEKTRSRIERDETALLMFGIAYLTATLFP